MLQQHGSLLYPVAVEHINPFPPSKAACRNFLLGILNFNAYS